MGRAGPGPVDHGFDRAGPGLGLEYIGPGWSGPRVGEPVANTAEKWRKPVIADNFASNGARAKFQRPACFLRRVEHVTMFF